MSRSPLLSRGCFPLIVLVGLTAGCLSKLKDPGEGRGDEQSVPPQYNVIQTWPIADLVESAGLPDGMFVQFDSVFWEPDDTISLRKKIGKESLVVDRDVLEIGTGTGLLSICCLQNGARSVVATDINPIAVANARYNAAMLVPDRAEDFDVRAVDPQHPGAFSALDPEERFDLILSNPPWEDGTVEKPADYAFYDPAFELQESILDQLKGRLKPGGRCLLAYGNKTAIRRLIDGCEDRNMICTPLDSRNFDILSENFLPGMLLEIQWNPAPSHQPLAE
ncbi:50S ribosomal protein L11 methyltransferase [Novipirellula artificiosorum]|uniref:N5-glutamine S-adenosyl-L-methionine-dependent methyltransferase n=1 Tax=Novipirellula artificiosorum TaxID=2528016 RepID=A0A5C6DN58_9BACT|nr:50S ribosomal protein L11 methyltransferase [Novipirellula artificiosorum]TWU37091.1 N5-glutamine S-adenosyl-L-methionine-dependent methyltransferase [Novipirellula artificiosorum]